MTKRAMKNNTYKSAENTLLIRLPVSLDEPAFWYRSEHEQGELDISELEQLSQLSSNSKVVILVPGELVLLKQLILKGSLSPAVIKSLPFRLEEELGSDVEDIHLAILGRDGDQLQLAVIQNHWIEQWQSWLTSAGIKSQVWLPETLVLKSEGGAAIYQRDDKSYIVNSGHYHGAVCDESWLNLYLDGLQLEGEVREFGKAQFWEEAQTTVTEYSKNLLQGQWQPEKELTGFSKRWSTLGVSSVLTVLIVSLWLATNLIDIWQLNKQSDAYQAQVAEIFTETMPGKRAIRPKSQLRQYAESLREGQTNGAGLLSELDQLALILKNHGNIQTLSIDYQRRQNQLRVVSAANDISDFTRLRDDLSGLRQVRLESLDQAKGENDLIKVTGVLVISGESS